MNTQEKIAALKQENETKLAKQINELEYKEKVLNTIGVEMLCTTHHDDSISIWVENSRFDMTKKFDRSKIKEYYEQLCSIFTPTIKPLSYCDQKYKNFVPASIKIENNTGEFVFNHPQTATIKFYFEGGISVAFKASLFEMFDQSTLKHTQFVLEGSNYKSKPCKNKYTFNCTAFVNVYGGSNDSYCSCEEDIESFMDLIFTGKFNG